jgi:hypothetical protein
MFKGPRGIVQGTLVLTNKRLALVNSSEIDNKSVGFASVDRALGKSQFNIPFETIDSVSGQKGILRTTLVVIWRDPSANSSTTRTEFIQRYRSPSPSSSQMAINEWIPLIEREALGESGQDSFGSTDLTELEARVVEAIGDANWIGFFQLERELEGKYEKSIDPDDLDSVLAKLVRDKVLEQDKVGEFYKKPSSGNKL